MLIGYARTSTVEQVAGLEAQERDLKAAGVDKVFAEQLSSVDAKRPALAAALDFARDGDTFVVTKLDRLARSVADLLAIVEKLTAKGVALRILAIGLDTATSVGRLMLNMLASVAQFEREVMLERQREGIAKAKAEGKFKGRAPTARAKAATCCGWPARAARGRRSPRNSASAWPASTASLRTLEARCGRLRGPTSPPAPLWGCHQPRKAARSPTAATWRPPSGRTTRTCCGTSAHSPNRVCSVLSIPPTPTPRTARPTPAT